MQVMTKQPNDEVRDAAVTRRQGFSDGRRLWRVGGGSKACSRRAAARSQKAAANRRRRPTG